MHCENRCNTCGHDRLTMPQNECCEPVNRREFDCGGTQRVIRHQHVVKHRHDTINEYDVVHEHEYNTFDVVTQREVVRHNDNTHHQPNYCDCPQETEECGCARARRNMTGRGFGFGTNYFARRFR